MPPLPNDPETRRRHWYAGGGFRAARPIPPLLPGEWRPGMPCHWMEETRRLRIKFLLVRLCGLLQLVTGIFYLQYRVRFTIGKFSTANHIAMRAYQIFFFALEVFGVFGLMFRFFEAYRVPKRNCIDLKQIPSHLIKPRFDHSPKKIPTQYVAYPSVGIFIPCYNEEPDLVLETVLGALNVDYPKQLLTVYLCDDGQDPMKKAMVSQLRKRYRNLFYVIRPEHVHAKAGNLNYAIKRTTTDLVVTLDADFVARPNILQRLVPYYYLWNDAIGMYEFNETLAVVQTPQYYRNLSPYDSDPLDQRSTFYFDLILAGKDWFNASTMVGTTNLISRAALEDANYFPYHTITEDTAMSLKFHSLKYRTFFVLESLAHGLATTTLWGYFRQRARWLKGDWQNLFSKYGPLTAKNLNIIQRILYLHMTFSRLISIVHMFYDLIAIVLLVFGITPLDVPEPITFIIYIAVFQGMTILNRIVTTSGSNGWGKSESGNDVFEVIFRYTILKGLFAVLFKGQNLQFKVTPKAKMKREEEEKFDENARSTVLGRESDDKPGRGMKKDKDSSRGTSSDTKSGQRAQDGIRGNEISPMGSSTESEKSPTLGTSSSSDDIVAVATSVPTPESVDEPGMTHTYEIESSGLSTQASYRISSASTGQADDDLSTILTEDEFGRMAKRSMHVRTPEERAERRVDMKKNLKRIWFNILFAILLGGAIIKGIVAPPSVIEEKDAEVIAGELVVMQFNNVVPLAMALGFAMANLLPHLLVIYLCFIPYISGWMMGDLVHGRCDQYAIHPRTGKLFVPFSFVSMVVVIKFTLIFGSMIVLGALALDNKPKIILIPN